MFFKPGRYNICIFNQKCKPSGVAGEAKLGQRHGARLSQGVCDQSIVEKIVLHKNGENGKWRQSCQQFTVKREVTRLRVSQLGGRKKTKRLPMVTRLFLHDAADISIGVRQRREKAQRWGEGCWSGTAMARRHFAFWMPHVLCRSTPNVFCPPPPLRRLVKGSNTCAQFGMERRKKFTMPRKRCNCLMS